jgi:hypothetical protein
MKREQTRVEPTTRVTDIKFSYQRGADVQATWRKFGWTPPSEKMTPPPPEKVADAGWEPMRRVK